MGPGSTHLSFPLFLLLLLAASSGQAAAPDDRAAQATAMRRRLIEQQQRATVCEVRSSRLDQQIIDLEEQLAATRDALAQLVAQKPPPEPPAAGLMETAPVETPGTPGNPIEVEELPDPQSASTEVDTGAPAPLTPPSVEALALYDEGYTLFHEKRYMDAVTRFRRYAELYPNTELTDNALFWIGECHYALRDFETALEAFTATVARYPEGNKVADALLKAGKCLMSLGEREEARRTFEEVVARFPDAAAAAVASELLSNQR